MGRPSIEITDESIHAYYKWQAGDITVVIAMIEAGLKKTNFYKVSRLIEE